jgi:hypothetical protein
MANDPVEEPKFDAPPIICCYAKWY